MSNKIKHPVASRIANLVGAFLCLICALGLIVCSIALATGYIHADSLIEHPKVYAVIVAVMALMLLHMSMSLLFEQKK